ncbi:MAG: TetR/AcrR family transcriptional regulator [Acidobacteria bacterium]|nr:TetR/AcrR family transcriptional regulator [Acidobacteriota bacterium]
MAKRNSRLEDLREACVAEALVIIGETGLEQLSLREVARRLGVSHQAPYKHFPSRDHILAEVVSRAYSAFATYLDQRPRHADPHADLHEMGLAYLSYAHDHPLHYRLMFETQLPNPAEHPEMMRNAKHAFSLLRDAIALLPGHPGAHPPEMHALFVWASLHGLAAVMRSSALGTLGLSGDALQQMVPFAMAQIGLTLEPPPRTDR